MRAASCIDKDVNGIAINMSTPVLTGLDEAIEVLQDRLVALRKKVDPRRRIIVAFAGAPGSGKSTITAGMLAGLQKTGISDVGVIPMVSRE